MAPSPGMLPAAGMVPSFEMLSLAAGMAPSPGMLPAAGMVMDAGAYHAANWPSERPR